MTEPLAEDPGYAMAIEVLERQRNSKTGITETLCGDEFMTLRNSLQAIFTAGRSQFGQDYNQFLSWCLSSFSLDEKDLRILNKVNSASHVLIRQRESAELARIEREEHDRLRQEQLQRELNEMNRHQVQFSPPKRILHQFADIGNKYAELSHVCEQRDITQAAIELNDSRGLTVLLAALLQEMKCVSGLLHKMPDNIARKIARHEKAEELALERARRDAAKAEAKACDAKRRLIEAQPPTVTFIQMPNESIEDERESGRVLKMF